MTHNSSEEFRWRRARAYVFIYTDSDVQSIRGGGEPMVMRYAHTTKWFASRNTLWSPWVGPFDTQEEAQNISFFIKEDGER